MINTAPHVWERKLSQGWQWVRLGEVCSVNPRKPKELVRNDDMPTTFIPMEAVCADGGKADTQRTRPYGELKRGYTYFVNSDVLFAKITPCMQNGKHFVAADLLDGIGFASTEFHVLRPDKELIPHWAHFYLRQPHILNEATYHFTGTVGQQRVPVSFLEELKIPLPPLSEQRRIVAVLNGKMAAVERARTAALERVEAVQALPAAFLREVFCFGDDELPQGWRWVQLGDVCEVQKGITPRIAWYADSGIRIIKFRDIANRKVNWTPGFRSFVRSEYESRLRQLKVGMTLIGADAHNPEYIGKKVSFTDNIPQESVFYSGELITIAPKTDCPIAAKWPFLWLSSCMGYKAVQEKVVGVHLNSGPAKNIKIPLPPLSEQRRIVATLNKKIAVADKARIAAEAELKAINALPAAFLREAFHGAL